MKKPKFITDLYNYLFRKPEEGEDTKSRRLEVDKEGNLEWSEGDKPFEDEDLNGKVIDPAFHLEDDKDKGTRTPNFKLPGYSSGTMEPFMKSRFKVEFPGIPEFYFSSYRYLGHDIHHEGSVLDRVISRKRGVIHEDYSEFKVTLSVGGEIDICDKLISLEKKPKVGDVKVHLLDPTGVTIKTIVIPNCEVTEIRAFRDLEYGKCGDKSDQLLYGTIVVKHKQRKLL